MTTLMIDIQLAKAQNVRITEDTLSVDILDGRTVSVPLGWYPRLLYASERELNNWRLIGGGEGIHWSDLDEDISIESIILGKASGESQKSFQRWLKTRQS